MNPMPIDYTQGQTPLTPIIPDAPPLTSNLDILKQYLRDDNSDDDSESSEDAPMNIDMYYRIAVVVLLLIILYYVYTIRREIGGMYEEL